MTTNLDVIKRALRKLGVLSSGNEPPADQASDTMEVLQSLVLELVGGGTFGRLYDVITDVDYTANENERIRAAVGITVTLPDTITGPPDWYPYVGGNWNAISPGLGSGWDYGAFYSGYPRTPYDRSIITVVQDGVETVNVYSAQTQGWVDINAMAQQDTFPLESYGINGMAAKLAVAMSSEFGVDPSPIVIREAQRFDHMISQRLDSESLPTAASYF
jgi:hypothetical protein